MHEDVQSNLYLQEQENQPPARRKRRSDTTDRYMVDFNEIDARLVDTLNQPSDSTSTNASATTASAKKGRKSATPANQHFITDYFRPPAASATTPLSASQPTSHVIKQESIVDEGFDRDPEQSQPHDNQSIVSSQGMGQSQQEHYYIAPPPPRTPQKRKPVRAPAIAAGFQTPERGRRGAVLEVPSSTPGLSPITKASLSAAAMAAAGLRDLSFVSPTPRARWRGAAPVVPPFRITRSHHARRQSSNDSDAAAKIGSVVAMSVWEDYEEVGIGGGCETGSETDEDYISDEHVPTAANLQKPSLQRDRPVLSGLSQLQPTQGRARAPQYEKELHLSSSSSGHSDHNNISGAEAENDIKLVHGNQLDPESDNENEEMLGTKAASESICSTVISIRSPLPMSDANDDYDYDNEDENGNIANDADDNDDDDDDGDYDARSAIFSSLEFPCAQRASDSIYSHEGSSSDHGEEEAGSGYSSSRKKAGSSGGRAAGAAPGAEANGHHDDNHDDEIGSSADDEVLRAWAEQRQRGPPALLLLESRYDPVDDRSLVADSEAAAAVMAAVAAEDDDDDLFSLPLQPRLRYRSSQFPSQSQSQSLMRSDSTTTTTTAGGGSRRGGERYLYSTQRPIDFDNDTEPEDEDMFDADRAGLDKLANGNMTESQQQTEDQQGQQLQQEQRHLNRRQEFAMPLTQYQQVSQALPITSTQQQHQEHQPLQTLINEPSPSTQYYVDRILTTSMLESLPLPELLPTSPAHLQLHQPHHRRANRK